MKGLIYVDATHVSAASRVIGALVHQHVVCTIPPTCLDWHVIGGRRTGASEGGMAPLITGLAAAAAATALSPASRVCCRCIRH